MADKEKSRLEQYFERNGRNPQDTLRVQDLIEYDNAHHAEAPANQSTGGEPPAEAPKGDQTTTPRKRGKRR